MQTTVDVPIKKLKFMYWYTIILPGLTGLTVIFYPKLLSLLHQIGPQDHFMFGVTGSMWLSFSILSIFALKSPMKFLPVLLFQFSYKVIWLSFVVFPLLIRGDLSVFDALFALLMVSYVIGDIWSIPFSYLFEKDRI